MISKSGLVIYTSETSKTGFLLQDISDWVFQAGIILTKPSTRCRWAMDERDTAQRSLVARDRTQASAAESLQSRERPTRSNDTSRWELPADSTVAVPLCDVTQLQTNISKDVM